ncbi:MAG: LysM peptidoglycan-binding domain-containing protein [Candidatus Acidiferrales bacterium]
MCQFDRVKAPRRNPTPPRAVARWLVATAPLACLTLLSTAPLHSQSVAEAARQERARQQADGDRVTHVYTDEDLAKPKILTPEDRERYAAALRDWVAPNEWQLADLPMQRGEQPTESLGDIAWAYRIAKMARQLEAAEAPDMPRNSALVLPAYLTAMPEPKLPIDGRAKRAMQANGRMHVPEPPAMPTALAYPVFTLTSPPAPAAPPAAATSVTPDLGLDAGMNLGLAPVRQARRPLSEVSPMELVRHETEPVGATAAVPVAPVAPVALLAPVAPVPAFDAGMNLALTPVRHAYGSLSEVSPMEPVRHEAESAAANHVAPALGIDADMNLDLAARHARRPLSEVRPMAPARHELETTTNFTPNRGLDANIDLDLATARHTRRPLSEVHPIAPVRHEQESEAIATVQPGDTLWHIAQQRLGSGYRWKDIVAANPRLKNSTKILVGEQLRLPFPESFSDLRQRTHRVNSGDSLWKLARVAFGNGTAWLCLAKANPEIQNPDLLLPGQKVQIPERCGPSAEAGNSSHLAANLAVK